MKILSLVYWRLRMKFDKKIYRIEKMREELLSGFFMSGNGKIKYEHIKRKKIINKSRVEE